MTKPLEYKQGGKAAADPKSMAGRPSPSVSLDNWLTAWFA